MLNIGSKSLFFVEKGKFHKFLKYLIKKFLGEKFFATKTVEIISNDGFIKLWYSKTFIFNQ